MSLIDRDRLLRQLRFLQQLLVRAKKAAAQKDFRGAVQELHEGYREALGLPYELLAQLAAGSALLMLSTAERRSAYTELLRAEADVRRAQGDDAAASAVERRLAEIIQASGR
jgi:hypothetical protein